MRQKKSGPLAAFFARIRPRNSVQTLHVGSDGPDFLIGHLAGDIAHHLAGIVVALTALEGKQLIFNVFGMLTTKARELRGRITRTSRAMAADAGRHAARRIATAINFLAKLNQ